MTKNIMPKKTSIKKISYYEAVLEVDFSQSQVRSALRKVQRVVNDFFAIFVNYTVIIFFLKTIQPL
jgi:hypothetical protein